ncbi:MAG: hypothetical protein CL411_00745 [Acidimicrobiaceae bacterium]|nr:hypothetical protein [Acidimicrobiaceae bacterium]
MFSKGIFRKAGGKSHIGQLGQIINLLAGMCVQKINDKGGGLVKHRLIGMLVLMPRIFEKFFIDIMRK